MRKNKGNYCKVCGKYKANEKFSGKGHKNHICKKCMSLTAAEKIKMAQCNMEENIKDTLPNNIFNYHETDFEEISFKFDDEDIFDEEIPF